MKFVYSLIILALGLPLMLWQRAAQYRHSERIEVKTWLEIFHQVILLTALWRSLIKLLLS